MPIAPHVRAALVGLATIALVAPTTADAARHRKNTCPLPTFGPGESYRPTINPADFSPNVTNTWFPLIPGHANVYRGSKDDTPALNVFTVTHRTKVVGGVRTRVVEDRLYLNNVLHERTSDYYAQDRCGNVWYFGEDTATLAPDGTVISRDGTFHAGVDGAQAGVFMQARPQLDRRFRQEWYKGHSEDTFKIIDRSATVTVIAGTFAHALRAEETTALEPDVVDNKYYVKGIGEVSEVAVKGGTEKLELIEVIR